VRARGGDVGGGKGACGQAYRAGAGGQRGGHVEWRVATAGAALGAVG